MKRKRSTMSRHATDPRDPSARYRVPAGVALAVIICLLYVATLTPGIPPTDSGELALAAWLPGIAHAPGFPFYTLLGWLWSHLLPWGRIIWRLNLFSAACAAATVGLTFALGVQTFSPTPPAIWRNRLVVSAALGAVALALGRTFWGWATVAEVYALNLALTAAILLLLVRWADARAVDRAGSGALVAAAGLYGLGLGGHLTSIALLAPAIAYWLVATGGWRLWRRQEAWLAGSALVVGASIYLYLPLRAAANPPLNWGDPDTWERFWWHVTAKQYRVSLFSSPVWPQVSYAARLWWTQFTPLGLGLLGLGAWRMARARRPLFWALLLIIVFNTLYAWAYVIEDDQDAYYLPAFLTGSIWVAWGAHVLWEWLAGSRHPGWVGKYAPAALVLVPIAALVLNWHACDRHADTIPEDYVRDTFAEIGPDGVLLTRDWQLYAPALYLQEVEGVRPDLTVIDTELMRRGWYFDLLHRVDPGLMRAVGGEEARFLALRDAWARGEIPADDPRIGQLQAAYVALLNAIIDRAANAGRPVYIGPNRGSGPMRMATLRGQPDMEPGVGTAWAWQPVGLSFRAGVATGPLPPLDWSIAAFDRVAPSAPERKIQATRADMATLRGLYQANAGWTDRAEADWRVALAVDPTYGPTAELLARLQAAR